MEERKTQEVQSMEWKVISLYGGGNWWREGVGHDIVAFGGRLQFFKVYVSFTF